MVVASTTGGGRLDTVVTSVLDAFPDARLFAVGSTTASGDLLISADQRLLTPNEREVAALVGTGMTNQQVARSMYLSPHTVNFHLRRIYRKLGISSRVELASFVFQPESL